MVFLCIAKEQGAGLVCFPRCCDVFVHLYVCVARGMVGVCGLGWGEPFRGIGVLPGGFGNGNRGVGVGAVEPVGSANTGKDGEK